MKDDSRNRLNEEDLNEAVNRFKRSLISGRKKYFDVSEFEGIVEQLLEEGDINSSEIAAKQGIQIHPNAVALHLKYAQVLLNKGKFEVAIKHLQLVEKVESTNPDVHLIKGTAWLVLGDEKKAAKSFNRAIKTADAELDDILYHVASAYIQAGNVAKAVHYFEKSVQVNPKNEMALYDLGFYCDQLGNFDKSIKYYNTYLDIDSFNYSTWFNLGITHNKAGNHKKAIEAYEFALALNDEFHQSLFNIANAHANEGSYKDAIKKYKEYLQLYPENDDALCYIGECYLNLDDYIKSEQYYQKAIKENRENDTAWFGIGLIMWVEKKYSESNVFIKKAIEIDDSNSEYWLTLGKVNNDYNNFPEAVKALKSATRLEPANSEIWMTWVDSYIRNGEVSKAVRILKLAINKSDDVLLKYRLVSLLLETKNNKSAFSMLLNALEHDSTKLSFLYEIYPKAKKSRKIKKLVTDYRKDYPGKI